MQSPWAAIGITLGVLLGFGLLNDKTQRISIYIALALALVIGLRKVNKGV